MFSCEFCEIFKNIFSYRTPLVNLHHERVNQVYDMTFAIKIYFLWMFSKFIMYSYYPTFLSKSSNFSNSIFKKCTRYISVFVNLKSVDLRVTAWKKPKYRVYFSFFYLSSKSLYSVQILENTDQKKLRIWALFTKWDVFRTLSYI